VCLARLSQDNDGPLPNGLISKRIEFKKRQSDA